MRQRRKGQSIVEMALVLPILLLLVFGIVDLGWYIYGYSTLYQAARNGAREASMLPPQPGRVAPKGTTDTTNNCVANILDRVQSNATLFPDLTKPAAGKGPYVEIKYPFMSAGTPASQYQQFRKVGQPIEVIITYQIEPLTPLSRLVMFGTNGTLTVNVTARRSIESLGENPNEPNLNACN